MKKEFLPICFILITLAFQSCLFEEDLIFDKSAAERLNKAIIDDTDSLQSANNGWVMEYFATPESPGYTLLIKFNKSGESVVAGKNELTENILVTDTCHYEMIGDTGPVLTFNSYSKVLHAFSEPDDSGLGLQGDFEFVVIKTTADQIVLRGKKRGTTILLRKLPAGQGWQEYFVLLENMNTTLFGQTNPTLKLSVDNIDSFRLSNGISHIFNLVRKGGDVIADVKEKPFIVTDYGLRFADPINIGELALQTFKLSADKNELICTDSGVNAKINAMPPTDIFSNIINARKFMILNNSDNNMSEAIKTAYASINTIVVSKTRKLEYIGFTNNKDWGTSLSVYTSKGTSKIEGFLGFSITRLTDSDARLKFNGFTGKYDTNGKTYYDTYSVSGLVSLLEGDYTLTVQGNGSVFSASTIRFTSKTNANKWFDLFLKN